MISIAVKDDGQGLSNVNSLPPFQLLSKMEYKTKNFDRNKNLGSGMGLCIVSNVIKKLGGEFIVQSKQDEKEMTSFEIRIPYYGDLQETNALDSDLKKTYLL